MILGSQSVKAEAAALLKILQIGRDASMRGEGISLCAAMQRADYCGLRPTFASSDLLPLIRENPAYIEEWISFSEDKRTSDGWYVKRSGEIGQVLAPAARMKFNSLAEAVAEYVVRELDSAANCQELGEETDR